MRRLQEVVAHFQSGLLVSHLTRKDALQLRLLRLESSHLLLDVRGASELAQVGDLAVEMELHLLIALLEICELELEIRNTRLRRHRPLLGRRTLLSTLPTFSLDLLLQLHVLFGHQLPCRLDLAQLLLSCDRLLGQLMHARARLIQLLLKRPLLLLLLALGVRHRVRHSTLLAILARHSPQAQLLLIFCMHRAHLLLHRGQSCLQPLHLSKGRSRAHTQAYRGLELERG